MAVKLVNEIVSGQSASLSLGAQNGGTTQSSLRYQRSWMIVLENPSDIAGMDVRDECGVDVGQPHPYDSTVACESIELRPNGDSRHSWIVTATYSSSPQSLPDGSPAYTGQDPRSQSPDVRPANWRTSFSTLEVPSWYWKPLAPAQAPGLNQVVVATNPVGDLYDGVATLQPVMTIEVEQLQTTDPNLWGQWIGGINSSPVKIGNLTCEKHTVMFRSLQAAPHVEVFGRNMWRGWKATYEFSYKRNYSQLLSMVIGWNVATPVSGFTVMNLAGATARNDVEKGALALKLNDSGSIDNWPNAVIEPTLVGEMSRANVLISAAKSKAAQRPSSQPVALNWDGTPRKVNPQAGAFPHIQVSQVYPDFDINSMGLRLYPGS